MQLILPQETYKESFLEALKEFHAEGHELQFDAVNIDADFDAFIEEYQARMRGVDSSKAVPDTLFWLVDGDDFIGRFSLRHELNERLEKYGGHIGYYIRPTKRGMSYATKGLALTLQEAKKLGLKKVLITCNQDNIGSQKVIEKNGGMLQDIIPSLEDGKPLMRWWIDIT